MISRACAPDRRNGFLWLALAVAGAALPLSATARAGSDEHLRVELISRATPRPPASYG